MDQDHQQVVLAIGRDSTGQTGKHHRDHYQQGSAAYSVVVVHVVQVPRERQNGVHCEESKRQRERERETERHRERQRERGKRER